MRKDHVEELGVEGYALIRELGRGGFSTVYQAEHIRLHRQVAVKILTVDLSDPAALRRFERECESMGRLSSHPCVVDVLDARVSPAGLAFIAMRLYEGSTLAHYIQLRGALASDEALHVGIRMADALASGHDMGIVHRDVKPENVLLDKTGESFLADFGVAALLESDRTATTSVAFTRPHAAPAVMLDNDYGPLSDVYSLASTLHQTLTGRPPFVADTEGRLMMMVLRDPAPSIDRPDLQPGLQEAILRGLEKDPTDRWPSMREFAGALENIRAASLRVPPASTWPARPQTSESREEVSVVAMQSRSPRALASSEAATDSHPSHRTRRRSAVWAIPLLLVVATAGVLGVLSRTTDPDKTATDGVAVPNATAPATVEPQATPQAEASSEAQAETRTDSQFAEGTELEVGPSVPMSGTLEESYQIGDCLDGSFGVVGCTQPHVLQVTGFASEDRECITAGEDFVLRGATYTTRVVHDRVRGPEIAPALTGAMCASGLVEGSRLQTFDFDLRGIVSDTLTAARLVGGCQAEDRTAELGDARDLGPCGVDRPWLSGHFWRKGPIPADPPACRTFAAKMGERPYVAEPLGEPFDTADLWAKEVDRAPGLEADEQPSFFVPRIDVLSPNGGPETFEAATAQAMPIPRPEDHPVHWRMVCGVKAY